MLKKIWDILWNANPKTFMFFAGMFFTLAVFDYSAGKYDNAIYDAVLLVANLFYGISER